MFLIKPSKAMVFFEFEKKVLQKNDIPKCETSKKANTSGSSGGGSAPDSQMGWGKLQQNLHLVWWLNQPILKILPKLEV